MPITPVGHWETKIMKKIIFGTDSRNQIKAGVDTVCDVVKVSLGKYGKNVLIYNGTSTQVINDGVSIAQAVNVADETQQAGIQLAKQCANQTNEDAGDGTTTTLVLLQAVLKEIVSDIQVGNPREIREKMFEEARETLAKIKVSQIKGKKDVYNLAYTSSLDEQVATLVSEIYHELGKDAQVSIEETAMDVLAKEIVHGMKVETKRADRVLAPLEETLIYEDVDVMVVDRADSLDDIRNMVKHVEDRGKACLVIIANSFGPGIISSISAARGIDIIPLEYKMFKDIEDVKDFVGIEAVGKVVIEPEFTTLIGGKGDVAVKVQGLRDRMKKEESVYTKEELEHRISSLLGRVAIIKVGKATDVARQEAVLKVEDALGAVKGAYKEGYTIGGGLALKNAAKGQSEGFARICAAPYEQICANAGRAIDIPKEVVDSFATLKHALMNAISTGTSILTAEAALIEIEDKD